MMGLVIGSECLLFAMGCICVVVSYYYSTLRHRHAIMQFTKFLSWF